MENEIGELLKRENYEHPNQAGFMMDGMKVMNTDKRKI